MFNHTVAPCDEGVWAPTIRVICPEDYFENAVNCISLGLVDIHAYVVKDWVLGPGEAGFIVEMREGEVFLWFYGPREMRDKLKVEMGACGKMSDGFEAAGFEINRVVNR